MARPSVNPRALLIPILFAGLLPCAYAGNQPGSAVVVLGTQAYRWPLSQLAGDEAPPARGPVELTLIAPTMGPRVTASNLQGAAAVRAMLAEVPITIESPEGVSATAMLERKLVNDGSSAAGSLERRDPRERLELRRQQPPQWGLAPYTVDDQLMAAYAHDYQARYKKALTRTPGHEPDWYIAKSADGRLGTFISCDPPKALQPSLSGRNDPTIAAMDPAQLAGCIHYFTDAKRNLFIQMSYQRTWLKDWKQMEDGVRAQIDRAEVK